MRKRPAIIAYDISKNKTRRQVHRTLQAWRIEGQKSVAECLLSTPEAEELCLQLVELMNLHTDRLALVWLDTGRTVTRWGKGLRQKPKGVSLH